MATQTIRATTRTRYTYNFGPLNYLQLPITRKQISGSARYDMMPGSRRDAMRA